MHALPVHLRTIPVHINKAGAIPAFFDCISGTDATRVHIPADVYTIPPCHG